MGDDNEEDSDVDDEGEPLELPYLLSQLRNLRELSVNIAPSAWYEELQPHDFLAYAQV